jgi:hypothetical protein
MATSTGATTLIQYDIRTHLTTYHKGVGANWHHILSRTSGITMCGILSLFLLYCVTKCKNRVEDM